MERKNNHSLVVAMAKKCRDVLQSGIAVESTLPIALQVSHLLWMCRQLERYAEDWHSHRSHRWLGFIQAAMLANRMLTLEGLRQLFAEVKSANDSGDEDLIDHLDPTNCFEIDIGGQG